VWSAKYILVPAIRDNGFVSFPAQDPDNPGGVFRRYLDRSMLELLRAGIPTTNDYEAVTLHVWREDDGAFLRGDSNRDGAVDISDAITTLLYLFGGGGGGEVPCLDALDTNDDGVTDISDASYGLDYLFRGGPAPPPPYPTAGTDPTPDELGCSQDR